MSSGPSSARSIASQFVLLFTIAAALLLGCSLGVLYAIVVRHATEEDNEVLVDKIFGVRADLDNLRDPATVNAELKITRAGQRIGYWIRVFDSSGKMVAGSPEMKTLLPPNVFPKPADSPSSLDEPINYRSDGKSIALMATRVEAGGQTYTIQAAQDRSEDNEFANRFRALLGIVLVCGTIASAFIAATVTKRGLRPLTDMTRSLKRVGPKHLHERVPPATWPSELQPLAVAFDEMMDRLEESFTRLSQFSADLAHELRTPIANLRGEAEVALTRPRSEKEYRDIVESSVSECERLSGIIDNLLFLARADAADRMVEGKPFDGRAAAEKIASYYGTLAEDRRVAIACTGEGEIYGDELLFDRALSNLVDNALRHTSDGGKIDIAITTRDGTAEVSVRDNGSGIPAEHLPRVFDRLYRADSSRSSEGSGLGLSLVKSITDLHGGSARIESVVEGGTTVTLAFPQGVIEQ